MQMVMCRSCGKFVQGFPDGDTLQPSKEECPDCGETEFKDIHSGRTIDAREE